MSRWRRLPLGEVLSLEYGAALSAQDRTNSGYPVYGSNGEVGRHDSALIEGPGIIVGRKGSVGALTWSDEDYWPIDTAYWVKPLMQVDLRWLFNSLEQVRLDRLDSSTGVPGLNRADAYRHEIPIPPLEEQREIAEIVDTVDETIRSTANLVYKASDFERALADDLLREASRDAAVSTIRLHQVILHAASGPSPTCEERTTRGAEWGLLKTTAVTWAGWDASAHKVPPRAYWGARSLEVQPGDVVVTKAGPRHRVGVVVLVNKTPSQLMVSGKMVLLRPDTSQVVPRVLAALLGMEEPQRYLDHRTTGMAESQMNFSNRVLLDCEVRLPDLATQRRISEVLETAQRRRRALEGELSKLHLLRSGLVADLLSGRVRTVAA